MIYEYGHGDDQLNDAKYYIDFQLLRIPQVYQVTTKYFHVLLTTKYYNIVLY